MSLAEAAIPTISIARKIKLGMETEYYIEDRSS
jgi:hypothetical protein